MVLTKVAMIFSKSFFVSRFLFLMFKLRFIRALDCLDNRVEKLRKESMRLTEKRDILLMSMDILKHNELLGTLNECKWRELKLSTTVYLFIVLTNSHNPTTCESLFVFGRVWRSIQKFRLRLCNLFEVVGQIRL